MGASRKRASTQQDGNVVDNPFHMYLSLRFLLISIFSVTAVAFSIGQACRIYLLPSLEVAAAPPSTLVRSETLPAPILSKCKKLPNFTYIAKHFETGVSTKADNMLVRKAGDFGDTGTVVVGMDGSLEEEEEESECEDVDEEEEHFPAGQHLLIDIKNVDGMFLNSEPRLARAMVNLIQLSGLTLLSYHCHQMEPVGVSCVGVLLESHVSFHTWPIEGVITFDLFTCGPTSLLPLVPVVEHLFGVQRPVAVTGGSVEKPHAQWSHKNRGFRKHSATYNPLETEDMNQFMLGWMEYDLKEHIAEVETDFQTVDIFDVVKPKFGGLDSYKRSLSNDDSYEARNPDLFRPDRVIYLDGIMQSRRFGEAAYHEALVHPALFSHKNPKRVAIIGGGEGATMREVLKHKTVEKVTMVEIDEKMVQASRQYIPEWSDCSKLVGSAKSCFDDPRAETFYTDAISWFLDRFGGGKGEQEDKYDVIIMDALDPSNVVDFSDMLYNNDKFSEALSSSLTEEGILVAQVGEEDNIDSPRREFTDKRSEALLMMHLQNHGFESAKSYDEAHGGFLGIWRFVIFFKVSTSLEYWYANQAQVDLALRQRSMETLDDSASLFRFFDGATMMVYQQSSRVSEEVFCRSVPQPPLCEQGHGFDPNVKNIPLTSFEVKESTIPNAGRGLFFKEPAPKGSYLATEESVHAVLMFPPSTRHIRQMLEHMTLDYFSCLDAYLFGYGYAHDFYGGTGYSVDPSILTFINHGCNGSYNMGFKLPVTEMTADSEDMPDELYSNPIEAAFFNPFVERNHLLHMHAMSIALRDIASGEELTDNYLAYLSLDNWESGLADYRAQCSLQGIGAINRYQNEHSKDDEQ